MKIQRLLLKECCILNPAPVLLSPDPKTAEYDYEVTGPMYSSREYLKDRPQNDQKLSGL
jgi:hypothetical protein